MSEERRDSPLDLAEPRCFVIDASIDLGQAEAKAVKHADKAFGFGIGKRDIRFRLVQVRFLPFWHVHCTSRFDYDRAVVFTLNAKDTDAKAISLHDRYNGSIKFPVEQSRKVAHITVHGTEHCITERDETDYFDVGNEVPQGEDKLKHYLERGARLVTTNLDESDFSALVTQSRSIQLQRSEIVIVPPNRTAKEVVAVVMQKVRVPISPDAIHSLHFEVKNADLYFRPTYVFEFSKLDKEGKVVETKLEELDATKEAWRTISEGALSMTSLSAIPWRKVFHLSKDVAFVILDEFGGRWWRLATDLKEVGDRHLPDIADHMKGNST
jgi:hypothetical protein